MGMKVIEVKRIRRKLAELDAGADMVIPDYTTDSTAQPMGGAAAGISRPASPAAVVQASAAPADGLGGYAQPVMAVPQQPVMAVVQQQAQMMAPQAMGPPGQGMEELFGCFDDCEVCLCGYCCTPCLAGQTHERAGLESGPCWKIPTTCYAGSALMFVCGLGGILQCLAFYWCCKGRQKIQTLAGAQPDDDCTSCLTWWCCGPCAACQEARTVNKLWEANGRMPLLMNGYSYMSAGQPQMYQQHQPQMYQQQQPQMHQQPQMYQQQQQPGTYNPGVQRLER
jgi:Cys-rich protein (TIGR01571 family)